jgi:hypothetical protein
VERLNQNGRCGSGCVCSFRTAWITEVWIDEQSHRASLKLPCVQRAIARGKPLIARFGEPVVTQPVGGHGLAGTMA